MGNKVEELKQLLQQTKENVGFDRNGRMIQIPETDRKDLMVVDGKIQGSRIGSVVKPFGSAALI